MEVLVNGLHVLGVKWAKAASIDDVLASKDSLRKGDQGEAVSRIQRSLGISEDGKYGSDTESAVASFQAVHVTEPHERGVVNAATYRAILAYGPGRALPAGPDQSSPPSSTPQSEPAAVPIWKKVLFAALTVSGVVGGGALLLRRKD